LFSQKAYICGQKNWNQEGIKSFDALHVAGAEAAKADVLLTTDQKLVKAAKRIGTHIPILNPLIWLAEVLYGWES